MFLFVAPLRINIKKVSQNAIHCTDIFKKYPKEVVYEGDTYIYGTMHNGAAVYYRKGWFC